MSASSYDLEMVAVRRATTQTMFRFAITTCMRRLAGAKRVEKRRMKDLVGKLVDGRLKWAGHMVRIKHERLPKIAQSAERKKHEGRRIWEDHS